MGAQVFWLFFNPAEYKKYPIGMVHLLSYPAPCGGRHAQLARTARWLKASVPYQWGW